jgi:hypothetical protein
LTPRQIKITKNGRNMPFFTSITATTQQHYFGAIFRKKQNKALKEQLNIPV